MTRKLECLKPERVFYYFEEISNIPRCSYNEEEISNYLKDLGKKLNLETIQDKENNIIIKKPGSPGYENSPSVILQGHMDMVCEKTDDSVHDFSKDPLDLIVEGDYVKGNNTTLGGDNGIALAMSLAILEAKDIDHPPLEVLFTTNEESGMEGARAIDPEIFTSKTLINIDSEEEGTVLVSCAGGERNLIKLPIVWEAYNDDLVYTLKLSGFKGGHSGMDINKDRLNSNIIFGEILARLRDEIEYNISYISGGSKSNAIPRSSQAILSIKKEVDGDLNKYIPLIEKSLRKKYKDSNEELNISIEKSSKSISKVFSYNTLSSIISVLYLSPNGVNTMSKEMEGLVESSCNLGVIETNEDEVSFETAIRSSRKKLLRELADEIENVAKISNGQWESFGSYPPWEYVKESKIRDVFIEAYKEDFNKDLNVMAIHAGLECGIFAEKFKDMDMISFGPNMSGVHSPDEKLSISSTERCFDLLISVLKKLK